MRIVGLEKERVSLSVYRCVAGRLGRAIFAHLCHRPVEVSFANSFSIVSVVANVPTPKSLSSSITAGRTWKKRLRRLSSAVGPEDPSSSTRCTTTKEFGKGRICGSTAAERIETDSPIQRRGDADVYDDVVVGQSPATKPKPY